MNNKSSSSLLISHEGNDDWSVWIGLPDQDPIDDAFGFIIGSGSSREEAVADAVLSLEIAVEKLQAPAGVIEEREL